MGIVNPFSTLLAALTFFLFTNTTSVEGNRKAAPGVARPSIPAYTLNLAEMGGVGDGHFMNTGAFTDPERHPTLEGPKFLKRNGWYYISAPAGGVTSGWQVILRSRNVYGPYKDRIVLAQRDTPINGPHQGSLVDTPAGEWWFIHFQDTGVYGRIVHLQPARWENDWPLIGTDQDANGVGRPVAQYRKPGSSGSVWRTAACVRLRTQPERIFSNSRDDARPEKECGSAQRWACTA